MRVGYIQDIFPKLSETFVSNEISGLNKTHDIKVFAVDREGDLPRDMPDVVYFKRRLIKEGAGALKAGLSGELLGKSAREHYFHMVADYFNEFSKDMEILHRHFATNSIIYYLARRLEVPYTLTTHAWDIFAKERYPHLNTLLKGAARIVTISNYNKEYLKASFALSEDKIEVVRMGINPERFSPHPCEQRGTRILSVGRLVEKKGFEHGIKSIKVLIKKYPDIRYTIIGTGPEEPKLRSLIHELKLEANVKIIQNADNEELLEEYKTADVFILPCITAGDGDMDGIPVVLMEAMAMEKAVISTKVSGIPELISHNENGLLVNQSDPEAMARAMDDVLSDKVDTKELGANARNTITAEFNLNLQVEQMERIFKEILSIN